MPSSPIPPTLGQLRAVLSAARNAGASRNERDLSTTFVFTVDNLSLADAGVSFEADAGTLLSSLLEAIERLCYIDTTVGDYAKPDAVGVTAADCSAFIANELKHVSPGYNLQSNMQRRMFNATLQKLVELGVWRAAVDAQRFQNQREAERKRRTEQKDRDEAMRREQERMRRAFDEERTRQQQKEQERWEKAQAKAQQQSHGWWAYSDGSNPFEEVFRQAYHSQYERAYESWDDVNKETPRDKPKARNKDRGPWHEVLGVPATADKATIKDAWRRLCSKWQPRTSKDALDPERQKRMVDINTAKDEGLRGL